MLAEIQNERLPGERSPPVEGWSFVLQRIEQWLDPSAMEPPWVATADEVAKARLLPALRGSEAVERGTPTWTVFVREEYAAAFLANRQGWTDVTALWPRSAPEEELPEAERRLLAKLEDTWKGTSAVADQAGLKEGEGLEALWMLLLRGEVEQSRHWRLWRRRVPGQEGTKRLQDEAGGRIQEVLAGNALQIRAAISNGTMDDLLDLVWEEESKKEHPRQTIAEYIATRKRKIALLAEAERKPKTVQEEPLLPQIHFEGPKPEAVAPPPLGTGE